MESRSRETANAPAKSSICLLAIDDQPEFLQIYEQALEQEGLEILTTTDVGKGLDLFAQRKPAIVLLDLRMPQMSGMEALGRILEIDAGTDVIMITGDYSTESAVEAIHKGASDYLEKPVSMEKLRERVGRLIAEARARQRSLEIENELVGAKQFEGMVSQSPLMHEVFVRIRRISPHFRSVLVTGPTGSGKELAAKALHELSPSVKANFAVSNCSALVESLLESELFGHVKGAFTGAAFDKVGLFEFANGGTVFLDEIGEMALPMQSKLLRVLQNREIQRVGSPSVRKVDVRVIAATHRDLRQMVAEKQFREDLYYRLSMVEIKLPSLAERKEDIPLLERFFVERYAHEYGKPVKGITPRAQVLLSRYSWPGNVRELENAIGHGCMMAEGNLIDVHDLPESLRSEKSQTVLEDDEMVSLAEIDRRHAKRVLERVQGNKAMAAKILQISRTTLYRLVDENEPEQ